jgi:hypothetical protein
MIFDVIIPVVCEALVVAASILIIAVVVQVLAS